MTSLRVALTSARTRLRTAGLDEADLEAEVLLRHVLHCDRASLFQRLNEALEPTVAAVYDSSIERRLAGEPTAYITGRREFYGRDFLVTPATLIPRPETELLVEVAIAVCSPPAAYSRAPLIVDVGTGSGAIALSLALELPRAEVYACDVSSEALAVARSNAERLGLENRVCFRRGSLLDGLETRFDLIAANLPYVTLPDWQALPREIREHEPRLALEAGPDGLDLIRQLLRQAPAYLRSGGAALLELGADQAEAALCLAHESFPTAAVEVLSDLAGRPRLLKVQT